MKTMPPLQEEFEALSENLTRNAVPVEDQEIIESTLKIIDEYAKKYSYLKCAHLVFSEKWGEYDLFSKEMLDRWEDDCEVVFLRGKSFMYEGQWEKALPLFVKSLQLGDDADDELISQLYESIIACKYLTRKFADSEEVCKQAMNDFPNEPRWGVMLSSIMDRAYVEPVACWEGKCPQQVRP